MFALDFTQILFLGSIEYSIHSSIHFANDRFSGLKNANASVNTVTIATGGSQVIHR